MIGSTLKLLNIKLLNLEIIWCKDTQSNSQYFVASFLKSHALFALAGGLLKYWFFKVLYSVKLREVKNLILGSKEKVI